MQLTLALKLIASWAPYSRLPQAAQAKLAESLQALRLRPGQKLYDYDSIPPGVALVAKGQMRLLALDEQDALHPSRLGQVIVLVMWVAAGCGRLPWRPPSPVSCG